MNISVATPSASNGRLRIFFLLFAVSGFTGLIYESIWSHYLKLFLGHAAYAQSLVLMIFMGGLALGSWLASRRSRRVRQPLVAYAIAEAAIGLLALAFHSVFTGLTATFHDTVLPAVGDPMVGAILKWTAASLIIVPQSVLLGLTFPLMSAGLLRLRPERPGATVAMLYFTNSIGAAIGVLASGFWLIAVAGLPGTMRIAGLANIALALVVWSVAKHISVPPDGATEAADSSAGAESASTADSRLLAGMVLVAAFVTGCASFIYEIGWIRMLSMVLGSTTHSFELMLSAFIIGLALGGWWIRGHIDRIKDPVRYAGLVQLLMGVFAVLSIPVYAETFEFMAAVLPRLPKTDSGFLMFTAVSHAIVLAVMLPATFAAGMTLPLFTYVLLKSGSGEAAIGRVYAANTLGAIAGVLFAVHLGMPGLGLKNLIGAGALLDAGLGVLLLTFAARQRNTNLWGVTRDAAVALGAIAAVLVIVDLSPRNLASGVFRFARAELQADRTVEYYRDGKTATVAVVRTDETSFTISTNGKPDASVELNPQLHRTYDEMTMIMAGTLPLIYKPDAKHIANIGFGSGLTTHTLLADPDVERVDTIEIEPAMVEGARFFGERVKRAYEDPRSKIHFEDAKTFFPLNGRRYDVIVAEPSNPWVSGVASLFSKEFYELVARYLVDDGVMVQWVQFYEFNDPLFFSIVKAMSPQFEDFVLFTASGVDGIIVARRKGKIGQPDFSRVLRQPMLGDLQWVGLDSASAIMTFQIANSELLKAYFDEFPVPANSDYYPYVDLHAPVARFKQESAQLLQGWGRGSSAGAISDFAPEDLH